MGAFKIVKLVDPIQFTTVSGGLVPRGAYNPGTDYGVGDSVDYNGSSYVMFSDAGAGTVPTDTTHWQVLANKGATGPTGDTGPAGTNGTNGTNGTDGAAGEGVPTGGTTGQALVKSSNADFDTSWSSAGSGDVVGPSSATDNAVVRFDSTTGKLIQDSAVTIADTTGDITGGKYNTVVISGSSTPTLAVTGTTTVSGANTGDQTLPVGGTPALTLGTSNSAGSSPNFLRRDDTILAFDATAPSTQAYGDSAAVGVATVAARRDHKHAMPASTKDTTAITGILKGNGSTVSAASSGTDYAPATATTSALKGNGSGGFSAATLNDVGAATSDYSLNSHKLTNVTDPTSAQDAATKSYVDATAQGLAVKGSVRLATAAALPTNTYLANVITITGTGVLTVDGSTVALNDRILVKDESAQLENGVYVCTTAGAVGVAAVLTRSSDMDASAEFPGAFVFSETGTANAGAGFVCTNSTAPTVGTTAITFTQFSGAGEITAGTGLGKTGNTLSIDTTVTVDKTTSQTLTNKTLTSPTLVTPVLGAASATTVNKVTLTAPATGSTLTILDGKTLTANNTLTLAGTDSTTMTFPGTSATIARTDAAQTFTGTQTTSLVVQTPATITVTSNAGTAAITAGIQTFTNSSAAAMTITLTTSSAVDGQTKIVRIYDFSAVAEGITWVNTENSTVTAPTTSNGSTTLPLTVGFMYNSATSKWRCVAAA